MKFIVFFFRFVFKFVIFCFVFGALGMAVMQFYGKKPDDVLAEFKEAMIAVPKVDHGTSIQQVDMADRQYFIKINNTFIDTRQISNIESVNQKDLYFSLCYDEECISDGELKVKRMSLKSVITQLEEKGITCYYPLKKSLINFKYFEKINSYTTLEGYPKYDAVLVNEQKIHIPKDRKADFERKANMCKL